MIELRAALVTHRIAPREVSAFGSSESIALRSSSSLTSFSPSRSISRMNADTSRECTSGRPSTTASTCATCWSLTEYATEGE